ncbi:hypothetical protein LC653_45140 [Nostoc sp. CHAB 5784]|uniref:hypothetical protein n=1 Tax=Nostoc mirabile TaxID=2907820 RepID=UPI001E6311C2|nr:hypothetical protein [Nostoc mirabile]MCC5670755.1 hypothetical protein [Nostoc mirabile CHAB5784]
MQVTLLDEVEGRRVVKERLRPFAESTYLHQVIERWGDDTLHHYLDLATALPHLEQTKAQEWRTHFHVPIFSGLLRGFLAESCSEYVLFCYLDDLKTGLLTQLN